MVQENMHICIHEVVYNRLCSILRQVHIVFKGACIIRVANH